MGSKIRHISLNAEDPRALAEFYKTTFGMEELNLAPEGAQIIYLSDGYIKFVILPCRGKPEGVDHFGFQVEDIQATAAVAEAASGPEWQTPTGTAGQYASSRIWDPVGTPIDLATEWGFEPKA